MTPVLFLAELFAIILRCVLLLTMESVSSSWPCLASSIIILLKQLNLTDEFIYIVFARVCKIHLCDILI